MEQPADQEQPLVEEGSEGRAIALSAPKFASNQFFENLQRLKEAQNILSNFHLCCQLHIALDLFAS